MDFKLESSRIETDDIVQYYPETDLHETFRKFGLIAIDGTFRGTAADFDLKSHVVTGIGELDTDMTFHINDRFTSTYDGLLKTVNLDLGILFDEPEKLQKLDFSGQVNGKGFEVSTASVNLDAAVNRLGFRGYDYRNVQLRGNLQKAYFNGQVSSHDPNLTFVLDGEIDLANPKNRFDLQGVLEKANLMELGFSKRPLTIGTRINAQVEGNTSDELVGRVIFYNTLLQTPDNQRTLLLDSLRITSTQIASERTIQIQSDVLTANLNGDFVLSEAGDDLNRLLKEYRLYFIGDEAERDAYYAKKAETVTPRLYTINYEVDGHDLTPLLEFLRPNSYVSPKSHAEGVLRMGNTALITLNARADSIRVDDAHFSGNELDVTTSKFANNAEVLASALVMSQQQKIGVLAPTERLSVEAAWNQDHIHFNSDIHQAKSTNEGNLNGDIRFGSSGLNLHLIRSNLVLLDEVWEVNPNNLISLVNRKATFENLALVNDKQRISLDGEMYADSSQNLLLEINNLQLATLNPVLETKLGGVMDAAATLRDRENLSEVNGHFSVLNLSYDNTQLGDMSGRGEWDEAIEQFDLEAHLDRNQARVFAVNGTFNPEKTENSLDLTAIFDRSELKLIEPFSEQLLTDVSGRVGGTLKVGGTPMRPVVEGQLTVADGKMRFDYLRSMLSLSDTITFSGSEISAQNLIVKDEEGNAASVSGGVSHKGFRDFSLGFEADMRNFKILNTTEKDNDLFYGTAYVTGKARLTGPIENLEITATVTSNKGTRMYIPLDGPTEVVTQDYIQFVSKQIVEDSLEAEGVAPKLTSLGGVKMDFNFNITPDAYCEIQLDRQAGDIIKTYGRGLLNMKVDTKGDFTMTGNYEIERGDYTFTFQNALNKKFTIVPGSRITWAGNPYDALLNVEASYTQMASLAVLPELSQLGRATGNSSELNRRYPVEVTIALTDRLMTPTIGYNLAVKQYPSSGEYRSAVAAFENRLRSNEQELSRQVSSLILFSQLLSPQEVLLGEANQGVTMLGNSVSELVSNQISRWASTLNENLEVGVSGLSLDQSALTNLQLRLSYRLFNDRFRITRDGRFTNGTTQAGNSQFNATSLLGEWTVEYWLAQSGNVRLKAYNRNIQNPLILNNANVTGGASMQFTHSFNRFKALAKPEIKLPNEMVGPASRLTSER